MIALVFGVIAAAMASPVAFSVAGSTSTSTGRRAEPPDAAGRGEERVGRRDHVVARPDAGGHQRGEQRIGARRHADRVGRAQASGDGPLERLDGRAEDEALAVAHRLDGAQHVGPDARELRRQVEQRHLHIDVCAYGRVTIDGSPHTAKS